MKNKMSGFIQLTKTGGHGTIQQSDPNVGKRMLDKLRTSARASKFSEGPTTDEWDILSRHDLNEDTILSEKRQFDISFSRILVVFVRIDETAFKKINRLEWLFEGQNQSTS